MNGTILSNGAELLDIGNGLKIGLTQLGVWQVCAKNAQFDLRDCKDFWRVVTLLEYPFSHVDCMFKEYAEKIGAKDCFPLWKVVGAGLTFEMEYWANLALVWFPQLAQDEQIMLSGLLEKVERSTWASQKSRQLARRYAKPFRRYVKKTQE